MKEWFSNSFHNVFRGLKFELIQKNYITFFIQNLNLFSSFGFDCFTASFLCHLRDMINRSKVMIFLTDSEWLNFCCNLTQIRQVWALNATSEPLNQVKIPPRLVQRSCFKLFHYLKRTFLEFLSFLFSPKCEMLPWTWTGLVTI
jgi:hypothetical protein